MENQSIEIRRLKDDDLDRAAEIFHQYRLFYSCDSDVDNCRRYLTERLERGESYIYLASFGGSKEPVGFMQCYPTFSSLALAPTLHLGDLFVAPSARRLGIATQLIEIACKLAGELGAVTLTLMTANDNLTAQEVYEKIGFKQDTTFRRYWLRVKHPPSE